MIGAGERPRQSVAHIPENGFFYFPFGISILVLLDEGIVLCQLSDARTRYQVCSAVPYIADDILPEHPAAIVRVVPMLFNSGFSSDFFRIVSRDSPTISSIIFSIISGCGAEANDSNFRSQKSMTIWLATSPPEYPPMPSATAAMKQSFSDLKKILSWL